MRRAPAIESALARIGSIQTLKRERGRVDLIVLLTALRNSLLTVAQTAGLVVGHSLNHGGGIVMGCDICTTGPSPGGIGAARPAL